MVIGVVNVVAVCLLGKVTAVVVSGDNEHNVAAYHGVSDAVCDNVVVDLNAGGSLGKVVVMRVLVDVSLFDHDEEVASALGNYRESFACVSGEVNLVVGTCAVGVINLACLDELVNLLLELSGSITVGVVAEESAGGSARDLICGNNSGLCSRFVSKLADILFFLLFFVNA